MKQVGRPELREPVDVVDAEALRSGLSCNDSFATFGRAHSTARR
jgi:hypothetical protein